MTMLPCPPQLWPRFSTLLDEALDLPEGEHAGWLSRLGEADVPLRPWLRSALEEAGSGAAASPGFFEFPESLMQLESILRPGDVIGPFRLEALIGEGGMGQVWRAGRPCDDGPQRQVALKLPHADLLSGLFKARFRRERDVLACLSHPNIAQLYDAGVSAEGIPYLALELVQGTTVLEHCRACQATLAQRLELITQMLDALSYAHQRLIVHRDIKPSNILVTTDRQVKLLDFGIAKLLREDTATDQRLTQGGALATPGYGAPEQFDGGAVTVAADVFSTGVVLFELVTGERPFETIPRDRNAPPAPLASRRAQPARIACPDRRLRRALAGDLDAIIAKALALDPEHRYRSAEAFRRDVQRWLGGQPVAARRAGWMDRTWKFARRNKIGVALASALAISVAGGTAAVVWQARRATNEAVRAQREAARATAIKDYLVKAFEEDNPRQQGKTIVNMSAKDLLDAWADRADEAFKNDPETEQELLDVLGVIFESQEDAERAGRMLTRKLELARQMYGPDDPKVVDAAMYLAQDREFFLRRDEANQTLSSIRDAVFNHFAADSLQRATWLSVHALSLRATHNALAEAIRDDEQAVRIFEVRDPNAETYADTLLDLSGYQYDAEQYYESYQTLQKVQQHLLKTGKYDVVERLMVEVGSGGALMAAGNFEEADKVLAAAQSLAEQKIGRDSTWYLASLGYRAVLVHRNGDRVRGDAMYEEALALTNGKSQATGQAQAIRRAYGGMLASEGSAQRAVELLAPALDAIRQHPRDESSVRRTEGTLGDAYDQVGDTGKARALLLAARNEWMQYGLPHSNQMLNARARWAQFLLDHGDVAGAAAEYAAIPPATIVPGPAAALAQAGLARIALLRGDVAGADAASDDALRRLDQIKIQYDVRTRADIWMTRAECLNAMGKKDGAAALLQQASRLLAKSDAPQSARVARAQVLARSIGQGK